MSPRFLAAAVACAWIAANAWFIGAHDNPPTFDASWYLEIACRLYHALREEGLVAFFRVYSSAFRYKAPLISVLPVPFFLLAGPSWRAAISVNLIAIPVLSLCLFRLGARLFSETAGLLAVAIAATSPLLFGVSRIFVVEFWLAALVAASIDQLLASDGIEAPRSDRKLGALLGFGLLLKVLFPLYILGPCADVLWTRYRELRGSFFARLERPLKTIITIAAAIALTWYAQNLIYILGYSVRAGFGDIGAHYGSTHVWDPRVLLRYWDTLIIDGPSYYYFIAALAVAAALGLREARPREALTRAWRERPGLRAAVLWLALPLAIASVGVNKDTRFMAPCIPAFALLLAGGLDALTAGSRRRALLLAGFFIVPAVQFARQTFAAGAAAGASSRLFPKYTSYSYGPQNHGLWRQAELVDWIRATAGPAPATVVIGVEHGYMNANLLRYLSARNGYDILFISYGYEELRIENTVARLRDKEADYLLLVDGVPLLNENVRILEPQVRALVRDGRLPFTFVRELALTPNITVRLYRRSGVIRLFGAPA